MYKDEIVYAVALSKIFQYKPHISNSILENIGSAKALFNMPKEQLSTIFHDQTILARIQNEKALEEAEKEIQNATSLGIKILYIKESDYPNNLKECSDAPIVLYMRGELELNKRKTISVVGTRNATQYGTRCCSNIIETLAQYRDELIIVSGLAFGIDISAHRAALANKIPTIGILAGGYNAIYPASHHETAHNMIRNGAGALISEFPYDTNPNKINFVSRNRIIAGICDALIVVESAEKGGALITAKYAQSYSREIFAIPGRIGDKYSEGTNELIRTNRASLFRSPEEMLKNLNWFPGSKKTSSSKLLFPIDNEIKTEIVLLLKRHTELDIDEIKRLTGQPIQTLSKNLIELEIEGYIRTLKSNRYEIV